MANEFLLIIVNVMKMGLTLGLVYFWYTWVVVYGVPWWRSTSTHTPQRFPMKQVLRGLFVTTVVALFVLPGCRVDVTKPTYRAIEHPRAPVSRWELPVEDRPAYDRVKQLEADAAASAELLKKTLAERAAK